MSSGNVYEKLFKAWASISAMTIGDAEHRQRDPEEVLRYMQKIIEMRDFVRILDTPKSATSLIPSDGWVAEWQRFYQDVFDLEVNLADVEIPPEQPGFGWVVMVARGLTLNQAWAKCGERFRAYSYIGDDLDKAIPTNDRTSSAAYAKRFRDCVEADEENKNLSADALARREAQSIILLERLLMELWYHWKTGEHLDIENVTLCAGSRASYGGVPSVRWCGDKLSVDCYNLVAAGDSLRARTAL